MRVNEIFYSLQGEGVYKGEPTVFVRLQGCNLRCTYCDTKYAQDPVGGEEWTVVEVVKKVREVGKGCEEVCITGGEPLLQKEALSKLVRALSSSFFISIETNGSFPPLRRDAVINRAYWSVDVKCPSSGVCGKFKEEWIESLIGGDQLKFVVSTREDLDFVLASRFSSYYEVKTLVSPTMPCSQWWLQEVWQFCMDNRLRLSLQDHKIVFGDKRGV